MVTTLRCLARTVEKPEVEASICWDELQTNQTCSKVPSEVNSKAKGCLVRQVDQAAWQEVLREPYSSQEAPKWPLPVKKLSMHPNKPKLSEEQAAVLRMVLKGQSIFFTGSAGNMDRMGGGGEQL